MAEPVDQQTSVHLEKHSVKCQQPLLSAHVNNQQEQDEREKRCGGVRRKVAFIFHSKAFNIAIVSLCALDGILVICMLLFEIEVLKTKDDVLRSRLTMTQFVFECTSLAIVSLFLIEIPIKIWLFGWKFYLRNILELIDAVVCIVSFAVDVFNIIRHIRHSAHTDRSGNYKESKQPDQLEGVQKTLADAAGLLVLFRLWRVIRIVNAIIISVTTTQEGTMRNLRESISRAEERIKQLEELLVENRIPIPPMNPLKNPPKLVC